MIFIVLIILLIISSESFTYFIWKITHFYNELNIEHFTKLIHDEKFGGIKINLTFKEFNKLGFKYGDSLDLEFSNGKILTDIPFFNGYYCKIYDIIVVCYKDNGFIKISQNCGKDLWTELNLIDTDTVKISINKKKKYLDIQNTFNLIYSDDKNDFETDEIFTNFRKTPLKNVFRGVNPLNDEFHRSQTVLNLCNNNKINFILNLSDNKYDIEHYKSIYNYSTKFFDKLYKDNKVSLLDMSFSYRDNIFKKKLGDGLKHLIEYEGPYYIHCIEGKDRTGFVCMLLELLCGYSYEETKKDYMKTYDNYFGINEETDKIRYNKIVNLNFDEMYNYIGELCNFSNSIDGSNIYLQECGLTREQIDKLIFRINK